MRSLLPFFMISFLAVYALLAWANDGAPEEHLEATAEQTDENDAVGLKIISWDISKVGTERFEYDRIANVLSEADIVALQGVEFSKTGETSLTVIASLIDRKINERICKGWFKSEGGERARHAFLWKSSKIGYVEKTGEMHETCGEAPLVIPVMGKKVDPNALFLATFFHKARMRIFGVASIHFSARPKKPAKEILAVFKKLSAAAWPTILVGNFAVGARDRSFPNIREFEFKSALDGLWVRHLAVVHKENVDLAGRFPELTADEIQKTVAGASPRLAEVSFDLEAGDGLKTQMIKKPSRDKSSVAHPIVEEVPLISEPEPEAESPEDLEAEATQVE